MDSPSSRPLREATPPTEFHLVAARLEQLAESRSHLFSDVWRRGRETFGPEWSHGLAETVLRVFGTEEGGRWGEAIDGYAEFAADAARSQHYFEKHGRYRWTRLEEIRDRYYEDEGHMMGGYLPGMLLSHYLWPHHFRLLNFFRRRCLRAFPSPPRHFYDVGVGCGMYSLEVLRGLPHVRGRGFDLSPHSIAFSRRVLAAHGLLDRYEFVRQNVLAPDFPAEPVEFVVSQEVLEHLEDPARFCRVLHRLTEAGGLAYISAAVNAALSDHIYLFRSPDEVAAVIAGAGWKIVDGRVEYAYDGRPVSVTPCVAAFVCQKPSPTT